MKNEGYRVYLGDMPLTITIADENRANIAYNLMYAIADNKAEEHSEPVCAVDDDVMLLTTDALHVVDKNGNSFKPKLDPEWYGTKRDNKKAKKAALDKFMEEAALDGEKLNRREEAELQEPYRVCSWDDDHCSVRFMPFVWDMDKANEMYNCLAYGVDPSVSISVLNDFDERVTIRLNDLSIVNCDGDVYEDHPEPDWAKNLMSDSNAEQDFADAVAAISTDEKGLEQ